MSRKFKVGDKVVCLDGVGTVKAINPDSIYQISIELDDGWKKTFLADGRHQPSCKFPTLFHIDEKPKQWVTKRKVEVTKWINIYRDASHIYNTEDEAKHFAGGGAIAAAVKLTGEYKILE